MRKTNPPESQNNYSLGLLSPAQIVSRQSSCDSKSLNTIKTPYCSPFSIFSNFQIHSSSCQRSYASSQPYGSLLTPPRETLRSKLLLISSCLLFKRIFRNSDREWKKWWAWEDLNFRPHAYQACALTN